MTRTLDVSLELADVRAGANVNGLVTIQGGGEAGSLSVALCYRERADYAIDTSAFTAREVSETLPVEAGRHAYPFSLPLPEDALPNYRSKHGELWWEVEARWTESGASAIATARIEIRRTPARTASRSR